MSYNCTNICFFPVSMRLENKKDPNEEWKKFKEEFLKLEDKALDYNKNIFKNLKELEVIFDPNDECEIPAEGDGESEFVTAYTPEFKLGQMEKNYFNTGKGPNCIRSVFYEFLRKNNPLTRWNTPFVIYEHVASEYDDYFISGIRFLGKGKYVMIKDNSEWDLQYDYETKDYKKKAFIEETEILEKNLDKDIFEEDNSFNL